MRAAKRQRQAARAAAFVAMTGPGDVPQVSLALLEKWAFELGRNACIEGGDPARFMLLLDGRVVAWSAKGQAS